LKKKFEKSYKKKLKKKFEKNHYYKLQIVGGVGWGGEGHNQCPL
jgi:hypothetical protein